MGKANKDGACFCVLFGKILLVIVETSIGMHVRCPKHIQLVSLKLNICLVVVKDQILKSDLSAW